MNGCGGLQVHAASLDVKQDFDWGPHLVVRGNSMLIDCRVMRG